LRRYRDEVGANASAVVPARLEAAGYEQTAHQVERLARFEFAEAAADDGDVVASVSIPGGAVRVLASEAIDPEEAERRIAARREELEHEVARAEGKLANERFVERAPADLVEAEREKLAKHREALERLA
jgi:valyl-tRNA synthetase